jgi:hypothetical protein
MFGINNTHKYIMQQVNIIERIINNHESILPETTKAVLIEIVKNEIKKDEKKYENFSKNMTFNNNDSHIFHVIHNVNDNVNIKNKRESILKNVNLFFDSLCGPNNFQASSTVQRSLTDTKLINGRIIKVTAPEQSRIIKSYNKDKVILNDDAKKILDVLLLDIWYVIEYIENNKLHMSFSKKIK